jgi:hypothetical protein
MRSFNCDVGCDYSSFGCFYDRSIISDADLDSALLAAKYACQCGNYPSLIEVHSA